MSGLVMAVVAGVSAGLTMATVTIVADALSGRRRQRRADTRWEAFLADFRGTSARNRARVSR